MTTENVFIARPQPSAAPSTWLADVDHCLGSNSTQRRQQLDERIDALLFIVGRRAFRLALTEHLPTAPQAIL